MSEPQLHPVPRGPLDASPRVERDEEALRAVAFVVTGDGTVIELLLLPDDGDWRRSEELAGAPLSTLAWFAHACDARQRIGTAIVRCATDGAFHEEIEFRGHDAIEPTIIAAHLRARRANGRLLITGVMTDITARRLLEQQVRETRNGEQFRRLAVEIAQELNVLLSIIAACPLLTRCDESPPATTARERGMTLACERAERLVRKLLAFGQQASRDSNREDEEGGRRVGPD